MTANVDLLVVGDLVLRDQVLRDGVLAVDQGKIVAVLDSERGLRADRRVDARGKLVLPGLVDTHVHTLSAPSEGVGTATAAAAAGGVTTIVDMPYDSPGPVNNVNRLDVKVRDVEREAHVDVGLYGTMAKVDGLEALPGLVEAGVLAFKFSLFETDPYRFPRIADGDLHAAFEVLAGKDIPIVLHAENQEIIERLLAVYAGQHGAEVHGLTRPLVSETSAIVRALELARRSGARVHIAHVTHPEGFALIDWYCRQGARVSGETCAHYLALNQDDVARLGAIAKVNPPIRDESARQGLWRELEAGRVATISTDHAPWPLEAKRRPMLAAASGIPGLETFLPALYTEAVRRGFSLLRLVELVSAAPARTFGLGGRKGRVEIGYDADLVLFDPTQAWSFDASRSLTSAKWSPFDGFTFEGRVLATFLRGRSVFEAAQGMVGPGQGTWLRRPT